MSPSNITPPVITAALEFMFGIMTPSFPWQYISSRTKTAYRCARQRITSSMT
jgi:hypothetical protein